MQIRIGSYTQRLSNVMTWAGSELIWNADPLAWAGSELGTGVHLRPSASALSIQINTRGV